MSSSLRSISPARPEAASSETVVDMLDEDDLDKLGALLAGGPGLDLTQYRRSTVARRVLRRMALGAHDDVGAYLERLATSRTELTQLSRDLLIGVTSFFRDPGYFDILRDEVIRPLVRATPRDGGLRVWVPGCSTGEEAYSLAVLFVEVARELGKQPPLQIFATDVQDEALEWAREGRYSAAIADAVSPDRLAAFFTPSGDGFKVSPHLREHVYFASHDLGHDAPFSRIDLVSCRNVLIYLTADAQRRVLSRLHYAVRPGGHLFLGASESPIGHAESFEAVAPLARIYRRGDDAAPALSSRRLRKDAMPVSVTRLDDQARGILVDSCVPPSIIVAADDTVGFVHGDPSPYVRFSPGEQRLALDRVLHDDLVPRVSAALSRCRREREPAVVALQTSLGAVRVVVRPAAPSGDSAIISFEVGDLVRPEEPPSLARELEETRSELTESMREQQRLSEALRLSREEVAVLHEELESAREELEATGEEVRSLNEELLRAGGELARVAMTAADDEVRRGDEARFGDLERRVAAVMATSDGLEEASQSLLRAFVDVLEVDVAELWVPGDDGLNCSTFVMNTPAQGDEAELLATGGLAPEDGLVAATFGQRAARWVERLAESPVRRLADASRLGFATGFAFPLVAGARVEGVVSCLCRRRRPVDRTLIGRLEVLGGAIGEFSRRAAAEAAARAHHERLGLAVEAAGAIVYEADLDRDLLVVEGAKALLGEEPPARATFAWWMERIHPDDRDDVETAHARALRGPRSGWTCAYRLRHRQGHHLEVEDAGRIVFDPAGRPVSRVGAVVDATARNRVLHELEESEHRFRQVLRNSPVLKLVFDERGRVLDRSRSWENVMGCTADTVAAVVEKASPADDRAAEAVASFFRGVTSGRTPGSVELEVADREGRARTLLVNTAVISTSREGQSTFICAAADITDRKHAERALQEANRQMDQYLGMLGHELRNPLAAILAASDVLEQCDTSDRVVERTRRILVRQTGHMAKIVDGLLDVSRIARGKIELAREPLCVDDVLAELLGDFETRAAQKGIRFSTKRTTRLWIEGDRVRLVQVLDGVLSNAVKYTPLGGSINVVFAADGPFVRISVEDSGMGIEPELLPHVFEPFRQGAQSYDRSEGGLGLGLALVRGLVELHGGSVSAKSDGRGKGTTIDIRLPRIEAVVAVADDAMEKRAENLRVLVIEDNVDAAIMMVELLTGAGHRAEVAHDGAQGLTVARRHRPDVIVCDLGLPGGMTGHDLARAVRNDPTLRRTRLVALSGYGRPEDKAEAARAGFDAHLTKPVDFRTLASSLSS